MKTTTKTAIDTAMCATKGLCVVAALLVTAFVTAGDANATRVRTTSTSIDTTPAGAEVSYEMDGVQVLLGVSPIVKKRIPRGVRRLTFKLDGYETLTKIFDIGRRHERYHVALNKIAPATLPAVVEVVGPPELEGAEVSVNGRPAGPMSLESDRGECALLLPNVRVGRVKIEIDKKGYNRWGKWVTTQPGQKLVYDVDMAQARKKPGQLALVVRPKNATVTFNHEPLSIESQPVIKTGLVPKSYPLEVTAPGFAPYNEKIVIKPGLTANVDIELTKKSPSGPGSILAFAQEDVEIFVDGMPHGRGLVTVEKLSPGPHAVEARRGGSLLQRKIVEVEPGKRLNVMLQAHGQQKGLATVRLVADQPGASISLDGGPKGPSPFLATGLAPGTHFVRVTADGFVPHTSELVVAAGLNKEMVYRLKRGGSAVIANHEPNTEVFVDGAFMGQTPWSGTLPVGNRAVVLKAPSGATQRFSMLVGAGKTAKLQAAVGTDPNAPKVRGRTATHFGNSVVAVPTSTNTITRRSASASTSRYTRVRPMAWSARALPEGRGSGELFVGWPYLVGARAGGGIGSNMDIGIMIQSAFDVISEVELRYQWTFLDTGTIAASVEVGAGGGIGFNERNSFFARVMPKASMLLSDRFALTARLSLMAYTDRTGPELEPEHLERDNNVRLTFGVAAEYRISDTLNIFGIFDARPSGSDRRLYLESFLADTRMYGMAGLSYMF